MKKNKILTTCAFFGALATATATVTINVGTSGWGDASAPANDLFWGILVDSDGEGAGGDFEGSFLNDLGAALDGFTLPAVSGSGGFAGGTTVFDEFQLVAAQGLTAAGPPPTFATGLMNTLGLNLVSGIDAGDDYGLIWFSTAASVTLGSSDTFGFQDAGTLPSDSSTITFAGTPGLASNAIAVPEPSAYAVLAGMLALGYVTVRRRR